MFKFNHNSALYIICKKYWSFLLFLTIFKFWSWLHYTLLSPLWEQIRPLWLVGTAIWASAILQMIFDIPAGYILDKYGYRRILMISTLIFIIWALCLVFGLTTFVFILTLVFSSFGRLFFGPGVNAYVLSQATKKDAGKFISLSHIFESLGIVLASVVLVFFISLPIQFIGIGLGIILIIAWILLVFVPKDTVSVHLEKKIETHHYFIRRQTFPIRQTIRKLSPVSTTLILSNFSSGIFYSIIWFVVPLMIANMQGWSRLGIWLGVFDFAVVIVGYLLGKLADRYDKKRLVFIGLLVFSIAWILLGFNFWVVFVLLWFIATTGDEMASISLWAWLDTIEKNHKDDGKISAILNLSGDLGWGIGPILAWVLYTWIWASWTIIVGWWMLLLTFIVYYILVKKHPVSIPTIASTPKPHTFKHKR